MDRQTGKLHCCSTTVKTNYVSKVLKTISVISAIVSANTPPPAVRLKVAN